MIEASEKTIAPKTPIKSCGAESAKCSGSSRRDPRSDFSASIPPSTTPSTINDILSLGPHFGSSEPKQPPSGKMRLPSHETRSDLATSLHPPVTVTMRAGGIGIVRASIDDDNSGRSSFEINRQIPGIGVKAQLVFHHRHGFARFRCAKFENR